MKADQNVPELLVAAVRDSYLNFLWAIPLVLVGILLTGSVYYFIFIRPHIPAAERTSLLRYLFPKENYTTRSAKVDIWVWLLNGAIIVPVFVVTVLLVSMAVGIGFYDMLVRLFGPGIQLVEAVWAIVLIQSVGYYFGAGFGQYSGHLAFHKVPVLWALHRAHHSAESANLFTFFRSHPLETVLHGLFRVACTSVGFGIALFFTGGKLLPETTSLLIAAGFFNIVAGFRSLDHTHVPVSYGNVLNIVWGGPVMHQIHHSAEEHQRDVNLAGAGYIYDWLFGTLYLPKKGETWRWGLNDAELGENNPHQSVRDFFVVPVVDMWRELGKLGRRRRYELGPASGNAAE